MQEKKDKNDTFLRDIFSLEKGIVLSLSKNGEI
jgi:hypothetical protein